MVPAIKSNNNKTAKLYPTLQGVVYLYTVYPYHNIYYTDIGTYIYKMPQVIETDKMCAKQ